MKKVNLCVCTISFIAASYCIITALIDYFHYETVASISLTEESPSNLFVICSADFNGLIDAQVRNYTYVHRFLGDYQACNGIDLSHNTSLTPTALMSDVKIYALQHLIYAPWHLSRLNLIYNSYPVQALISASSGYSVFIAIEKLRVLRMPDPYDTQCRHFDKYKCIYDCSQMAATWMKCLRACSKPECETAYLTTLSHTAVGSDNVSKLVIEQESTTIYLSHYVLILFHRNTCRYHLIPTRGALAPPTCSPGQGWRSAPTLNAHYLHTFYWSTLAPITIGDLPWPRTKAEYLFLIVELVSGLRMSATVLGMAANIVTNVSAARKEFQGKRQQGLSRQCCTDNINDLDKIQGRY
ncbi:Cyclic nucleotide-gated channel rod photoreceptor subunit alpha [Halotydeus destructor]|nr:Cyclic nucleotide-gated channel rod photoreceptor subunit alpha [Halotydeus destructor]